MPDQAARSLKTRRGDIRLPGFFPVTTFGTKYPLDRLIRPYLPRLCQGMLVSHHYAAHLDDNPNDHPGVPLFIDSGGFALLFEGSSVFAQAGVFGIRTQAGDHITPDLVLQRQMRHAEIGATLDFPIPPSCDDKDERKKRFDATVENADWALRNNRRPDLCLYASLQCWDAASACEAARNYSRMRHHERAFSGIAIGGMVPRLRDRDYVRSIIESVRAEWAGPIHVFGVEARQWSAVVWSGEQTAPTRAPTSSTRPTANRSTLGCLRFPRISSRRSGACSWRCATWRICWILPMTICPCRRSADHSPSWTRRPHESVLCGHHRIGFTWRHTCA